MLIRPGEKFNVVNLGCKVNRVEADTITAYLLAQGCVGASRNEADAIIVNTCTVTAEADKKARKAVRSALAAAPGARVIVTGCCAELQGDLFRQIDDRVIVVKRAPLLQEICGNTDRSLLRMGEGFRTRVNVKVQDGCDNACTYCIVHVARGPASSVPAAIVQDEVAAYLRNGAKEIVLTGIDSGSYRSGSHDLAALAGDLLAMSRQMCAPGELPARLRISSLEPLSISDGLVDLLASSDGLLCRHLHLPLQSGSTKVLDEMARPYTAEEYCAIVESLYKRIPSLSLTTDIIVGFPGETDDDFAQTLQVAQECRFSKIHVFPYSRREGTPAAARDDQIEPSVVAERAAKLRRLSESMRRADRLARRGTRELVLIESDRGLTESYHGVAIPGDCAEGQLLMMTLD